MSTTLTPHYNLWLERNGQVVLSKWRIQLLEAIEETGSISAAAEQLEVPYRRAWERLNEMEKGLGVQLVTRQAGGSHGGGAQLTEVGRAYVARFKRFEQGIEQIIAQHFEAIFQNLAQHSR